MKRKGKFILLTLVEFDKWLNEKVITRKIKLIQMHCTWSPDYKYCERYTDKFKPLFSMEQAHLMRGFDEIAQNLTIFPNGMIAICRDLDKIPAGAKGANQYGICIENIGNFDDGGDVMSMAQRQSIMKVCAMLCKKFKLKPSVNTIVYHHWYDRTTGERLADGQIGDRKSCPGTNFFGGNTIEDCRKYFIPTLVGFMK